jgi:PAS domain S-box-containing protein
MIDNDDIQNNDRRLEARNAWQLLLRRRAEDADAQIDEPMDLLQGMSYDDAQLLFHELRVHQIELEMQNEELRRLQIELEVSRSRYFDLYDLAPVGYCTVSESGQIEEANRTMAHLLGVTCKLLTQRPFTRFIHPLHQDTYYLIRNELLESGLLQTCEIKMIKGDSTQIWVGLVATVVMDTEGAKVMRLVLTDVTSRKYLDDELLQKNKELLHAQQMATKANQAKSEFLANMSHDLRSPLNSILGFAQLLASGTPAPTPRQMANLDHILNSGWYLLELINGVLDLASIESGKLSLTMGPVPLPDVLQDCQTMMDLQAKNSGVDISFPEFDGQCLVHADRTRLKQVLINLLTNAVKYNRPQGTVDVTFTMPTPHRVRINVQDSGHGLSPEKLAQLFQPFNRLGQECGTQEGTGIGLVVSRKLVEMMGGSMGVQSTAGVGSVFWFELMLSGAPVPETNASEIPELPDQPVGAAYTVLYIEDNPANMALVEQLVERRPGVHLLGATNATVGLAMVHRHQPQLILMDINLPGINGFQALKILRDDPATQHIPVLAISANVMPNDIQKGLDSGFLAYLTKPVKVAEFMAALDRGLALTAKQFSESCYGVRGEDTVEQNVDN